MTDRIEPIAHESIPRALDKAERYRLLNEPFFAESICLDVLAIEPENPRALVTFVLALTDQFAGGEGDRVKRAGDAIAKMGSEYERVYYTGIVAERRAVARLARGGFGANTSAWRHIRQAIDAYTRAHELQPDHSNDDATLRRNTCVRLIELHGLHEPHAEDHDYPLE